MLDSIRHIHLIGVGGIGMSGLAKMLLKLGKKVSGSDLSANDQWRELKQLGATMSLGHDAGHVTGADLVVYSSAIVPQNPELQAALTHNIPTIRRAKMLGLLCRAKRSIAITGAHGKTTTSSMLVSILDAAKLDPNFIIGGVVNHVGSNARGSSSPLMVIEADESDGSFIDLAPQSIVITNIDAEHLDFYKSMPALKSALYKFAQLLPADGHLYLNADDASLRELFANYPHTAVTWFGIKPHPEYTNYLQATAVREGRPCSFVLNTTPITLQIGGTHNIYNALAATAVALKLGVAPDIIAQALQHYHGVRRRSELKAVARGIYWYDDYAHHPTEVATLLSAFRAEATQRGSSLVVVFQPHRYSRFTNLYTEFLQAYAQADLLVVLPIYAAGESNNTVRTSTGFVADFNQRFGNKAHYAADLQQAFDLVMQLAQNGDLVLTTGAGDVCKLSQFLPTTTGTELQHAS